MPNVKHNPDSEAILDHVLRRAATDRDFRNRLITEPERAIEEIIGVPVASLPNPVRVKFVEKDAGLDALVVLPDFEDPEEAMSDAELEAVAGGWCITSCTLTQVPCTLTTDGTTGRT